MEIHPFFDERTSTLTYLVFDPESKDALIIDPVLDYDPLASQTFTESVDAIGDAVRERKLRLRWVVETHAHADHLSGAQLLRERYGCPVAIGTRITKVQAIFKDLFALPADFPTDGSQFDHLLEDDAVLEAGRLTLRVIPTPGHTPACASYQIGDAVFTGDALFIEDYGTGRCDFPGGSAEMLYESVQRLYTLPDEMRVCPGHDYRPGGRPMRWHTTIGAEREHNKQLRADTSRDRFVATRRERDATLSPPRLLYQSVQVNIDAGRLPRAHANGIRYFRLPLNTRRATDDAGSPRNGVRS